MFYAMLYDLLTVWTIILLQKNNTLTNTLTKMWIEQEIFCKCTDKPWKMSISWLCDFLA